MCHDHAWLWCLFWFLGLRRSWAGFPGSLWWSLVQRLHSHLFSIYARQDAFIRICRSNQPSPDSSHCYSVSVPPLLVALWISKLKNVAHPCGFRDTCLLAPLLTQCLLHHSQHPPLHFANPLGFRKEKLIISWINPPLSDSLMLTISLSSQNNLFSWIDLSLHLPFNKPCLYSNLSESASALQSNLWFSPGFAVTLWTEALEWCSAIKVTVKMKKPLCKTWCAQMLCPAYATQYHLWTLNSCICPQHKTM